MLTLVRAMLAGTATGSRSSAAIAALIRARSPGLFPPLSWPIARPVAALGVLGELAIDKLPCTPSRLVPIGLGTRFLLAGLAGLVLARESRGPALPAWLVAGSTALISARVGHDVRAALAEQYPPWCIAALEDVIALALAREAAHEHW